MEIQMNHIGMVVSDLQVSKHFWIDTLGFQIYDEFDFSNKFLDTVQNLNSEVKLHILKIADDAGIIIELQVYESHPTPVNSNNEIYHNGIRHFAITVDDVDKYYQRLIENGYETLSAPQGSDDLGWKLFFARDPENNLIELVQVMQ